MPDTLRQFKASIFQALAHPTRIAIIEVLRDGELSAEPSSSVWRLNKPTRRNTYRCYALGKSLPAVKKETRFSTL